MIAWAVVKAMEKQVRPPVILDEDRIVENEEFDLGRRVSLERRSTGKAVVTHATKAGWPAFVGTYNQTWKNSRGRWGRGECPLDQQLGAFGWGAAPIVVPLQSGLFLLDRSYETLGAGKEWAAEVYFVVTSTSVVNGAGAQLVTRSRNRSRLVYSIELSGAGVRCFALIGSRSATALNCHLHVQDESVPVK